MKKRLLATMLLFFPLLVLADGTGSSLSFTPPPSDYSVVFLGNLFGIVDGILHGTGSQIMGSMFAVFNAAVLALSGLVIMYTLLVSTMNTAHEGQMLGQKWSSMWIPVRSTAGLALLIPKASGYCLMQIFVMWIVVQGVGAADKVWDAALGYLNRGGAIVKAQDNPVEALKSATSSGVAGGAETILTGQVCMLGLQKLLEDQLQHYQDLKNADSPSGPCADSDASPEMKRFCNTGIPSFLNTVNAVSEQSKNPDLDMYKIQMPSFNPNTEFASLNGICGTLTWKGFPKDKLDAITKGAPVGPYAKSQATPVSSNEIATIKMSRAIAIQQMYLELSRIAQVMVNNSPTFRKVDPTTPIYFQRVAIQQYGVPHDTTGDQPICSSSSDNKCLLWGDATNKKETDGPPIFNGTEFRGAMQDYDAVMLPTLNLVKQATNNVSVADTRAFITDAKNQGWMMAGSYFFGLISLNVEATSVGRLADTDTGLDGDSSVPKFDPEIAFALNFDNKNNCIGRNELLCKWLNKDPQKQLFAIQQLIDGGALVKRPNLAPSTDRKPADGQGSSTVYGYMNNATILRLPDQPGQQKLTFANAISIEVDPSNNNLPPVSFKCGNLSTFGWVTCLGSMIGDLLYNGIFRNVYNYFLQQFQAFINGVILMFLTIPLEGMASIFKGGMDIIAKPGVNPIVALAQMGTYYINFVSTLWMDLLGLAITSMLFPMFGMFVVPMLAMTLPLLLTWFGIMLSIGFSTAYYVPIFPYMIFTFGTIAWLMAVIEAMVAAPIVALGVTHPEGHEAFGKGDAAIMILMNVFLRPSMMIIGYISAIALSYVSVWVINAGFDNAISFVQRGGDSNAYKALWGDGDSVTTASGDISGGYSGWAGIYAYFFSILVYVSLYLAVVQKAFTLIAVLPDKVLRWIGGQPESYGSESAGWGDEVKQKVGEAGKETQQSQSQTDKGLTGELAKAASHADSALGSGGSATSSAG